MSRRRYPMAAVVIVQMAQSTGANSFGLCLQHTSSGAIPNSPQQLLKLVHRHHCSQFGLTRFIVAEVLITSNLCSSYLQLSKIGRVG